jgi:hypothetical protein
MVANRTFDPKLAAATAASQPACPAPTTITSYFGNIFLKIRVQNYVKMWEKQNGRIPLSIFNFFQKKPSILNKTTKLASPFKQNSHSKFFHSDKNSKL